MKDSAIGIDVGGTNIRAGIVKNNQISSDIIDISTPDNWKDFKEEIEKLVWNMKTGAKTDMPTGFALPGLIEKKNSTVILAPNLSYMEKKDFRKTFYWSSVGNDTDMALIGELGQKKQKNGNVALFNIGTGVGFAFYINGLGSWQVENAGEGGHIKLVPGGKMCGCRERGCLEAYFSGTALLKEAKEQFLDLKEAKELFTMARDGDRTALEIIDEASRILGVGIAKIINILGVEEVIIGGKLAESYDVFMPFVYRSMKSNIFAFNKRNIKISRSHLIDKAAIIGAANYALNSKE